MIDVCVKIEGTELIYCKIDQLPSLTDTLMILHDPRLQGDKDVPLIRHDSSHLIVPIQRILYIEVLDEDGDPDFPEHFRREK